MNCEHGYLDEQVCPDCNRGMGSPTPDDPLATGWPGGFKAGVAAERLRTSKAPPHPPWLTVINREQKAEALPWADEESARNYFDSASMQWSESWLCRVEIGPRDMRGMVHRRTEGAQIKTSDSSPLDTGMKHAQTRASDEKAGTANAAAPSPGGAPKSPGATYETDNACKGERRYELAVLEVARHVVAAEAAYRREYYPGLSGARREELRASRSYWLDQLGTALDGLRAAPTPGAAPTIDTIGCSCSVDDPDEFCPYHGRVDHLRAELRALRAERLRQETEDDLREGYAEHLRATGAAPSSGPTNAEIWAQLNSDQLAYLLDAARAEVRRETIEECAKAIEVSILDPDSLGAEMKRKCAITVRALLKRSAAK